MDEDLETGRMARQLEEPEYSDDGEELENVGVLHVLEEMLEHHVAVEAERGDKIDPVEGRLEKTTDGGSDGEPNEDLEREPHVANEFDIKEGVVRERLKLVERPVSGVVIFVSDSHVANHRHSKVGMRFQAERQNRR